MKKRTIGIAICLLAWMSTAAFARLEHFDVGPDANRPPVAPAYRGDYDRGYVTGLPFVVEVNANEDVFEARMGKVLTDVPNALTISANVIHNEDEYTLFGGDLTVGNRLFAYDIFEFSMGFRGVGGTVERYEEDRYWDDEEDEAGVGAVGFLLTAAVELVRFGTGYGGSISFDLLGEACVAPSPLCFSDTDTFTDLRGGLGINILDYRRGTVIIGYRSLEIEFDEPYERYEVSDDGVYFGYRFKF